MNTLFRLPALEPSWTMRLKLMALALMLIDHVHLVFFQRPIEWLYWLSRLVFPIFVLIIAQNLEHHRASPGRYIVKLIAFGVVAQPFYWLCFGVMQLNVLFTLASSIAVWWLLAWLEARRVHALLRLGLAILLASCAHWLEFGWAGLLALPIIAALFRRGSSWDWLAAFILAFGIVNFEEPWIMPLLAVGAWALFSRYPGETRVKPNHSCKYSFYAFYPLHLALLALTQYFI
jgi:TraX protein